jgi:hypothetical protein
MENLRMVVVGIEGRYGHINSPPRSDEKYALKLMWVIF